MNIRLNSNGNDLHIGGIILSTPGLEGDVAVLEAIGPSDLRTATMTTDNLEAAFLNANIIRQQIVQISNAREVDIQVTHSRSTSRGEMAMEIRVPDPGPDWGQCLLYIDEGGVMSWHFDIAPAVAADTNRGRQGERTYRIRRRVAESTTAAKSRGLTGAIGKKLIQVLAFALIDPVTGMVGDHFVNLWEKKKRAHGFRTFTPDNYNFGNTAVSPDWGRLKTGDNALLLVHGTNSRSHVAFEGLSREFVEELHRRYQGRVFAFDHPTLSFSPIENAAWFFENIACHRLNFDIICHSRGGLVSRLLAERSGDFPGGPQKIEVNKTIFVAAPNSGTILTDANYMGDFIDAYTNILNFFPDNGITDALEGIITVAKQLSMGTLKGLAGLQAMRPKGSFLRELNTPSQAKPSYYAFASNYEPSEPGFRTYAINLLTDQIFKAKNDLVVPTGGVYEGNGSNLFPIRKKRLLDSTAGVAHTRFFHQEQVRKDILEWLSTPVH